MDINDIGPNFHLSDLPPELNGKTIDLSTTIPPELKGGAQSRLEIEATLGTCKAVAAGTAEEISYMLVTAVALICSRIGLDPLEFAALVATLYTEVNETTGYTEPVAGEGDDA